MATLTPYKGLDVVESATGAGGVALTDNFKALADRAPYETNGNPGSGDDSGDGFSVGDLWLNTSTATMWVCVDASSGAAVWKSFYHRSSSALELIPQESSEKVQVAGALDVGGSITLPNGGTTGPTTSALGLWIEASGGTPYLTLYRASGNALHFDNSGLAAIYIDLRSNKNLYIYDVANNTIRMTFTPAGKFGIGTSSPAAQLDVSGDTIGLRTNKTVTNANDAGTKGDICWDSSYVYVCIDTDTWKRAALSTW